MKLGGFITLLTIFYLFSSYLGKVRLPSKIKGTIGYTENAEFIPLQEAKISLVDVNGKHLEKYPIVSLTNGEWTMLINNKICDDCFFIIKSEEECISDLKIPLKDLEIEKKEQSYWNYKLNVSCVKN